MKRKMLPLWVGLSIASVASANLLLNPWFESGGLNDWFHSGGVAVISDNGPSAAGIYAAEIPAPGNDLRTGFISVIAGQAYDVRWDYKVDSSGAFSGNFRWFDSAGTWLGEDGFGHTTTTGWETRSFTSSVAPVGAVTADVVFFARGDATTGSMLVDNVSARSTAVVLPPPPSLALNPGFETGTLDDWFRSGGVAVISDNGPSWPGTFAAEVPTGNNVRMPKTSAVAGRSYDVSLDYKTTSGGTLSVNFRWFDSGGGWMGQDVFLQAASHEWTPRSFTSSAAPVGAVSADVVFFAQTSGSTIVDNISVSGAAGSELPDPEIQITALDQLPSTNDLALSFAWTNSFWGDYAVSSTANLVDSSWSNLVYNRPGEPNGSMTVTTSVDQAQSFYRVTGTASDWFPEQRLAKKYSIVNCPTDEDLVSGAALQGLVAKAVNEGRHDELLVTTPFYSPLYDDWTHRTENRTHAYLQGTFSLMDAVTRYRPLVDGYVLYRTDVSTGGYYTLREGINRSANIATMMAGLLDALPVSEDQEAAFIAMGFQKLFDARNTSLSDVLGTYDQEFNKTMACSLDPLIGTQRDLAVAHKMAIYFGNDELGQVSTRMNAPYMTLGWGVGDEFAHVAQASRKGGIQTVSNWARNLSFLSAGSSTYQPTKIQPFDLGSIDWNDSRRAVSFMLSDGDNTGWILNDFWHPPHYGSALTGDFPMGFSTALAQMSQMAPVVIDKLAETKPGNVSLIEFSGGYFYPDLFAEDLPNRLDILREHAHNLNAHMEKTGARLLCFIVSDSASQASQEAYQIFAEELEVLDGMLVIDYAPYHAGLGNIYWTQNQDGIDIPAVTARFSMWEGMNDPNAGDPEEIASLIEGDTIEHSWTAVHAWSKFGLDELQATEAIAACIDSLSTNEIHVVTPEEMIWRIRMEHNPEQTQTFLE